MKKCKSIYYNWWLLVKKFHICISISSSFKYSNIFPSKCNQNAIHHLTRVDQLTVSIPSNSAKEKRNHSISYFIILSCIYTEETASKITNEAKSKKLEVFIHGSTHFFSFPFSFFRPMRYVHVPISSRLGQLTGDPRFQIRRRSSFPASRIARHQRPPTEKCQFSNGDEEDRNAHRVHLLDNVQNSLEKCKPFVFELRIIDPNEW